MHEEEVSYHICYTENRRKNKFSKVCQRYLLASSFSGVVRLLWLISFTEMDSDGRQGSKVHEINIDVSMSLPHQFDDGEYSAKAAQLYIKKGSITEYWQYIRRIAENLKMGRKAKMELDRK